MNDFETFSDYYEKVYINCVGSCTPGDAVCWNTCVRAFDANIEKCPCKSECPGGCPCEEYECPQNTNKSVLILNQQLAPVLTNAEGLDERELNFGWEGNATAYQSCSLSWQNQMYVFGGTGSNFQNQISRLDGCKLQREGNLAFDLIRGACTNFNDETIYLCFSNASGEYQRCRVSDGPTEAFKVVDNSLYPHQYTRIASDDSK